MTKGIFLPRLAPGRRYALHLDRSVAKGKLVAEGQRLGKLVPAEAAEAGASDSGGEEIILYSSSRGWITVVHFNPDSVLNGDDDSGAPLLDLSDLNPCGHDVVINRLCCACGEIVRKQTGPSTSIGGIQISKKYAESISQPKIQELYRKRKLMLILDLDHTLIHAEQFAPPPDFLRDTGIHAFEDELDRLADIGAHTPPGCATPEHQVIIDGRNLRRQFEIHKKDDDGPTEYIQYIDRAEQDPRAQRHIRLLESAVFFMETKCDGWPEAQASYFKLRPGVFKFLREMSALYELYIYTAGVHQHASTALSLLDPDRRFFPPTHVFSRDAVSRDGVKSLSRVLPSDHHAMIVIDDTPAAWDNDVGLFVCYPYVWFGSNMDHFVLPKHPFALDIKVSAFRYALWQYAPSRITSALLKARSVKAVEVDEPATLPLTFLDEEEESTISMLHTLWTTQEIETRFGETLPRELRDSDLQLFSLCGILKVCHELYFDALESQVDDEMRSELRIPSLKHILDELRRSVLRGTRVYYGDPPPGWQNTQSCSTFECLGCEVIHNDEIRAPSHILLSRNDVAPASLTVPPVTMDWLEYAACTLSRPEDGVFEPRSSRHLRVFWDACALEKEESYNTATGKRQRLGSCAIKEGLTAREWLSARHLNSADLIAAVLAKSDSTKPRSVVPLPEQAADDLELELLQELCQE